MTTWVIPGPKVDAPNEVVREVTISTDETRSRSSTTWMRVRLGVRSGDYTSFIGEYDQSDHNLNKGTPRSLLDERWKNLRLKAGQELILEMSNLGGADPHGLSAHFQISPSGGTGNELRPNLSTDTATLPQDVRPVVDAIIEQSNRKDAVGRHDTIPITAPIPALIPYPAFAADTDHEEPSESIQDLTYNDGTATVTVTVPAGGGSVYVIVDAAMTIMHAGALAWGYLAIGDGTNDYGEQIGSVRTSEDVANVATSWAGTITATTTFKIRHKYAMSAPQVERETISYLACAIT